MSTGIDSDLREKCIRRHSHTVELWRLIWQQAVHVQLAWIVVEDRAASRIIASRPDIHLSIRNRRHGKLHGISGSVPGSLRAIPKLRGHIRRVVRMKYGGAAAGRSLCAIVPVVQSPNDSVRRSGRGNRWSAAGETKTAGRLRNAGEAKHARRRIESVTLQVTVCACDIDIGRSKTRQSQKFHCRYRSAARRWNRQVRPSHRDSINISTRPCRRRLPDAETGLDG